MNENPSGGARKGELVRVLLEHCGPFHPASIECMFEPGRVGRLSTSKGWAGEWKVATRQIGGGEVTTSSEEDEWKPGGVRRPGHSISLCGFVGGSASVPLPLMESVDVSRLILQARRCGFAGLGELLDADFDLTIVDSAD